MAGKEPQHVNFALRFQRALRRGLILPLAIFQGVTGLLIWFGGRGSTCSATYWLLVAIVLYVIALVTRIRRRIPTADKLIEATSAPPPPPSQATPPRQRSAAAHRRAGPAAAGCSACATRR